MCSLCLSDLSVSLSACCIYRSLPCMYRGTVVEGNAKEENGGGGGGEAMMETTDNSNTHGEQIQHKLTNKTCIDT